jgi:hypothetical protein
MACGAKPLPLVQQSLLLQILNKHHPDARSRWNPSFLEMGFKSIPIRILLFINTIS